MRSPALLLAALAAACASRPAPEPQPPPEVAQDPRPPDPRLERLRAEQERSRILHRHHLDRAQALLSASRLRDALIATELALMLDPMSEEARTLKLRIERSLGLRRASVEEALASEVTRQKVVDEERLVSARVHLKRARAHAAARDWDEAIRSYERVLFLVRYDRQRLTNALERLGEEALAEKATAEERYRSR